LIVAETAKCLDQDVRDLALNRSSIHRQRQDYRSLISARLKEEFRADVPRSLGRENALRLDG